ncbi:MAG TPA: cyclic nucleotide-gated ion channel [Xanthobacteraceae bacterium]|nr:cyclic nucleotide-gated ion channel [Xanthobacteraceae bacterium]
MKQNAKQRGAAEDGHSAARKIRRRLYQILEQGPIGDRTSWLVGRLLALLIIVNLLAMTLESVPSLEARYHGLFEVIEIASLILFSAEYLLRLWVAVEHAPHSHLSPVQARLKFVFGFDGLVDLLAVLPFWVALFFSADLRFLLVLRAIRFLKLVRHSTAMRSLFDAIYSERRALLGSLGILAGTTMISASMMYLVERDAQPDRFGTIPDAMWWAIVTLGTVGYGDAVPVTVAGKLVAAVTILFGLMMVALPVGIIASAFANEIRRRDFVVTWSMVARFPLFAELNAMEIADIIRLLKAQTFDPGDVIIRKGEEGHSMYFIAAGEIEIELPKERVRLGPGEFFGEMAALKRSKRSATATAVSRANLLILDANDLRALMERDQRIAEQVRAAVLRRGGGEP